MRCTSALVGVGLAVLTASPRAQLPGSDAPRFDVISVKPIANPNVTGHNDIQGNAYVGQGVTLFSLVALANDPIPASQIAGGPDWIRTERFDVRATFVGNPTRAQINAMLRDALAQRFALRTHIESRRTRVLQLVMSSGAQLGPSLHRSTVDCTRAANIAATSDNAGSCMFHYNNGHIEGRGISIDQLAAKLIGDRVVINRTGLTGAFDLNLQWTPTTVQPPGDDAPPSLATALQEQLGLRLESTTAPLATLVIDHCERPTKD